MIDPHIQAAQLARIRRLESERTISSQDADEAQARAGQVMVLPSCSETLVHVYGLSGEPIWTHVHTYPGAPQGMAAALDAYEYMCHAVHDHYEVNQDALGRTIARRREE